MSDENTGFAELTRFQFQFLQGGAHPQEMVQRAAHLGYQAVGLADRNTLAGVVRGHVAAREAGIRLCPVPVWSRNATSRRCAIRATARPMPPVAMFDAATGAP